MKLNHIDLVVADVASNRDFLANWFEMTVEVENEAICLMRDSGDMRLILRPAESGAATDYPSDFHLGFFLGEEAVVTSLYGRMTQDGIVMRQSIEGAPPKFRCLSPAGLLIEVAHVPGVS